MAVGGRSWLVGRKGEDPVQKSDSPVWYEHSWRVDFALKAFVLF
jgi:hypothetical protein